MKSFSRVLLGGAGAIVLIAIALYSSITPNHTAAEGAADPIVAMRRPVVEWLDDLGVLAGSKRFGNPRLPTRSSTATFRENTAGDEAEISRAQWICEPVYRGLFWFVGRRISYSVQGPAHEQEKWTVLRLCCLRDGHRVVVAESQTPAEGSKEWRVSGFAADPVAGYWVEWESADGVAHPLESWGEVEDSISWDS